MKKRIGFVSNSSSSSFVIFKEALSEKQVDMLLNIETWIDFFIKLDEKNDNRDNLKDKFEYYNSDPWNISEHEDYIFGETSMDNFDISDYFDYINIDGKYIAWDEGYVDEPYDSQLNFIKNMKKKYRKDKLDNLNKK